MNIEELKQGIVLVATGHARAGGGKVLVYAEMQDGELSSALFYERGAGGEMAFDDEVTDLQYLIRELWEQWHRMPRNQPWSVLACLVDGDRVEFDFSAPGLVSEGQVRLEEHLRAFKGHTGDTEFDVEAYNA